MPLKIEITIASEEDRTTATVECYRLNENPTDIELEIGGFYRRMIDASGEILDILLGDKGVDRARKMNEASKMMNDLISKVKH